MDAKLKDVGIASFGAGLGLSRCISVLLSPSEHSTFWIVAVILLTALSCVNAFLTISSAAAACPIPFPGIKRMMSLRWLSSGRGYGMMDFTKQNQALCGATAFVLGFVVEQCVMVAISAEVAGVLDRFAVYTAGLALFHFLEFQWSATFEPQAASWDSFLLNHSVAYGAAMVAAWVEFALEAWLLPGLKSNGSTITIAMFVTGALMVLGGQAIRTLAMWTCGSNFTHWVATGERRDGHQLVTEGIFKFLRHPSYFGWFWWSVGTQMLLGNPLCLVAYFFVMIRFFADRIVEEETALMGFFGPSYTAYAKRTPIGIPMVASPATQAAAAGVGAVDVAGTRAGEH